MGGFLLSYIRHLFVMAALMAMTPIAMADDGRFPEKSSQSDVGLIVSIAPPAGAVPSGAELPPPGPQICPLFVSPQDPVFCLAQLAPTSLTENPDTDFSLRVLDHFSLLDFDHLFSDLAPSAGPDGMGFHSRFTDPLALTIVGLPAGDETGASPRALRAAYDVPQFFEGLTVTSSGAIRRTTLAGDLASNSANGRIGLTYKEYGINVNIAPDVLVNWGDMAGSETRYGVVNQVSTDLAPNLSLMLSSAYNYFSYEDPLQNRSVVRGRMGLTYKYASGYRIGASFRSQNAYDEYDSRYIFGPGISVTVPVSDTVSFTATNQFDFTQLSQSDAGIDIPQYGRRQQVELQANWTPKAVANQGMTVTAGYAYTYDTLTIDSAEPRVASARIAVAMRF